jgi:phenylacetate-coenzyme A ligase PaaK-like adenylate-forming protein
MGDSRHFESHIKFASRACLQALQESRAIELLAYVYERSVLYKSVWDAADIHPRKSRHRQIFASESLASRRN